MNKPDKRLAMRYGFFPRSPETPNITVYAVFSGQNDWNECQTSVDNTKIT